MLKRDLVEKTHVEMEERVLSRAADICACVTGVTRDETVKLVSTYHNRV